MGFAYRFHHRRSAHPKQKAGFVAVTDITEGSGAIRSPEFALADRIIKRLRQQKHIAFLAVRMGTGCRGLHHSHGRFPTPNGIAGIGPTIP